MEKQWYVLLSDGDVARVESHHYGIQPSGALVFGLFVPGETPDLVVGFVEREWKLFRPWRRDDKSRYSYGMDNG